MRSMALLMILVFLPSFATAHTSGASLEKDVGSYRVDVGYDPAQPQAGDRMIFDFGTFTRLSDGASVDFDYVWVRITKDKVTLLATGISRADIGPTSLLFMLPDAPGELLLYVRYQKGEDTLAEASFPIAVAPREHTWSEYWPLLAAAGAGAGGALFFMFLIFPGTMRRKTE